MENTNVKVIQVDIAYTETTAKAVFLPPNCIISNIKVLVKTAFNAGTDDLLTIGTVADDDKYVDDLDITAAGVKTVPLLEAGTLESASDTTELRVKYTPSGTAPSTGLARVFIEYVQR
jgi:hypothetical protein